MINDFTIKPGDGYCKKIERKPSRNVPILRPLTVAIYFSIYTTQ
jgi:hypothetical protein